MCSLDAGPSIWKFMHSDFYENRLHWSYSDRGYVNETCKQHVGMNMHMSVCMYERMPMEKWKCEAYSVELFMNMQSSLG